MKICDLTQFYSPVSGGVKRYLHEKIDYVQNCTASDKHVLVVPGPKSDVQVNGRSRIYTIRSPLVSRAAKYRALLNLRAVKEILDRERPDIIESGDPYQLGWKAVKAGRAFRIPVIGFYSNRKLLLYVGRLAKEKNIAKLFRAFEVLQRRRTNEFHLLVIGDGSQRNQLRKLQARCKNVSWIRYCAEPRELAQYYRAADLFVHPGVLETFGLVALERPACGTPVVGIRRSATDDLIFHDQRDWANENTAEALAEAIEQMSKKKLS